MRVHDNYPEINVKVQEKDDSSVLSFWKQVIQLRKEYADLFVFGDFEILDEANEKVFTYIKRGQKQSALIVLNFSDDTLKFKQPAGVQDAKVLLRNVEGDLNELQPFEGRVLLF